MNILHLDSSINGENSASRTLSAAIVHELRKAEPGARLTYRDLVRDPLDHLTLPGFATEQSQQALSEFMAADTIVIGTGMYNLSIPTQLKAWFDRVAIAGQTFRYTENGPQGLAVGKRVIVALARGGFYGADSPARTLDHAESYIAAFFSFLGVTDVRFVIAEGLNVSPEQRRAALDLAHAELRQIYGRRAAA